MRPKAPPNYLTGYPVALTDKIRTMIAQDLLADMLLRKYPHRHAVRNDKALYDYVSALKNSHLRNAGQLRKVGFDSTLHITRNALGIHTSRSRVQGAKLKAVREIHVASIFKDMPDAFLRMIVVHELAHMKEPEHDKPFYKLCCNMEPDYHQLEFDLRAYLTYLEITGKPLWPHR